MAPRRPAFEIAGTDAPAGKRTQTEIPIARLMSGTPVAIPVIVLHGRQDGPTIWLNAATHGDEIGGVEIIRQVLAGLDPRSLRGTLVAVPIVNVHGFNSGERYLPDRRDLNRAFPGSARGSLAARVAHLMMTEVVSRCELGIDLHTGSDHRTNLPQIRADLADPQTRTLAEVFGAPVAIHSRTRDGSLREAATERGATCLLYEGGEAMRFDRPAINAGVAGVRRVLRHVEMVDDPIDTGAPTKFSRTTKWVRAAKSGIVDCSLELGEEVDKGQELGLLRDPFGKRLGRLSAPFDGIVIGKSQHPLVNRGDAVLHVASLDDPDQ